MGFGGSAAAMNAAIKRNAKLRRHGKGIFDNQASDNYRRGSGQKHELPQAPHHVRRAFQEEAAEHRRRERRKWIVTIFILLTILFLFYHFKSIPDLLETVL